MTSSAQKPTQAPQASSQSTQAPTAPVKPVASPAPKPPPGKVGIPSTGIKKTPAETKAEAVDKKSETTVSASKKAVEKPSPTAKKGWINIKEAGKFFGAHLGYAFLFTIGILIAIEWLMPGAVLPFINIISLLPFAFIIVLLLIAFRPRKKGLLNLLSIFAGILISLALFASMLADMPLSGLRTYLLAGSIALIITVWAIAMYTEY